MKHARSTLPTPTSTNSFWHTEPNEFLLGHRTTADLPSQADIVIVGSGITGTSVARFLSEDDRAKGKSIVLLEAREACWGATGRNGGHCQPLLFTRGPEVAAFELKNVSAVSSYIKSASVPCEWRSVSGCMTLWRPEILSAVQRALSKLSHLAPDIATRVRLITDKDELRAHRVDPACLGATLTAGAGSLWPYKLVTHILESLVKGGKLNLQTSTPVTEISSSTTSATDKGVTHTLTTPRGAISTSTVILATNGYTSALLPSFADLIVPVRGSMSALFPPEGSTILPDSYGMVGALGQPATNDDYLIQRPFAGVPNPAGHLMFGGGRGAAALPTIGVSDDSVLDEGSAAYLRSTLLSVLELGGETEGLKELQPARHWTGIMGYSRDDRPWVGGVPGLKGVWLCGGYTGHGMPNGTLCGKAVVQMVLGEAEGLDGKELQEKLVEQRDLPRSYLISEERVRKARGLPTVEVQDRTGVLDL
ncbi:FAD dependent oxidoreductase [Lophiostoma macrostomum CBS 122681]|uniref:FAD dependent oxidoreductase n=1 Tax=Lophiostoma macrostomum CBS 122681 TaxID=1314788 RepID=A0A6A6TLV6_9PLEO|nr:FAD dependent oxidoreductase [Lophiostoma macrostomum CBS 122681]